MERIFSSVLLLGLLVMLAVLACRRRAGAAARHRRPVVGGLLVPASPLVAACLGRQGNPQRCVACTMNRECWYMHFVPAMEEIDGQPAATPGSSADCGVKWEQVIQFLGAVRALIEEATSFLALPVVQQAVRLLIRLAQAALAAIGRALNN
jgi:hypothetical protein